jgi:hypothetical protein
VPLIKDNACLNEPYFRPTTITLEDLGAAGKTLLPLSWPRCAVRFLQLLSNAVVCVCGRVGQFTSAVRSVLCLLCQLFDVH